jgi:hypothetical protein
MYNLSGFFAFTWIKGIQVLGAQFIPSLYLTGRKSNYKSTPNTTGGLKGVYY